MPVPAPPAKAPPPPAKARFFRDQAALSRLAAAVGPEAVPADGGPYRVWVPAGSTGDDAYSTALVLLERLAELRWRGGLRVLATGADAEAIRRARRGVYERRSLEPSVSPRRLRRFFVRDHGGWRAGPALRRPCLFAQHELAEDLPFVRLDAVYCPLPLGNWFAPRRRRALELFYLALKPGGLLLVTDPAADPTPERFEPLGGPGLYRKRPPADGSGPSAAGEAVSAEWRGGDARGLTLEDLRRRHAFAAKASRELRAPLALILGYLEALNTGVRDPRQSRALLLNLERNAKRMLATVESLARVTGAAAGPRRARKKSVTRRLQLRRPPARGAKVMMRR